MYYIIFSVAYLEANLFITVSDNSLRMYIQSNICMCNKNCYNLMAKKWLNLQKTNLVAMATKKNPYCFVVVDSVFPCYY